MVFEENTGKVYSRKVENLGGFIFYCIDNLAPFHCNHFLGFSCIQHFVFRCCTYYYPLQTLSRNKIWQLKNFFLKKVDGSSTCCSNLEQRNFVAWQCLRWVIRATALFNLQRSNLLLVLLHLKLVIPIVLFALGCGILGLWGSTLIDLAVLLIFRYERPENCEDTITVPIYLREKRLVDTLYMFQSRNKKTCRVWLSSYNGTRDACSLHASRVPL